MNILTKCLGFLILLFCIVPLWGLIVGIGFVYPYDVPLFVFAVLYLFLAVRFLKGIWSRDIGTSIKWLAPLIIYLAIILFFIQYAGNFWQYGSQAQTAQSELLKETSLWRNEYCKPAPNAPASACANSENGFQLYQCDEGTTYCGI